MPDQSKITRVFLGWEKPVLWSLIDWLVEESNSSFDYSGFTIIAPSKRAQSRISELLILDAKNKNRSIISPSFYPNLSSCLGSSPNQEGKSPISISESLIIWAECIKEYNQFEHESRILSPEHLATYLEQLRKDLLAHLLKVSDILPISKELLSNSQIQLCEELNLLNNAYEENLKKYNFYDDLREVTFSPPKTKYIFVGFHSLSPLDKYLIEKFNLTCFNVVGAPSSDENSFLEDGSLNSILWSKRLPSLKVNIVANPFIEIDSIKAMVKFAESEDISLSILDETLIGPLQTSLLADDINALALGSKPFTNSLWGSWLLAYINLNLIGAQRVRSFFEHPITCDIILNKECPNVLTLLDKLIISNAREIESLDDLLKQLGTEQKKTLLETFNFSSHKLTETSSLELYCKTLLDYIAFSLNLISALDNKEEILIIVKELNALIESPLGSYKISLEEFLKILKDRFINLDSTFQVDQGIPIIGWQETYLDDSSTIIISDCIEGKLPAYPKQDPLLTEQIKNKLGLPNREDINARDNFILHYLSHSKDKTLFLAPKETTSGDFNKLSKLCVSGLDDSDFLSTLNKFYSSKTPLVQRTGNTKLNKQNPLPLPPKTPYQEFPLSSKTISPSQIRDYLRCPYNFYLNHILNIRVEDYIVEELPSRHVGQILHEVFAKTGTRINQSKPSSKTELFKWANAELDRIIDPYLRNIEKGQLYALQSSYMRSKVQSYIDYEWDTINKKPEQILTEVNALNFLQLELPNGENIEVKGRIDRIEVFQDQINIIDFKTGDTPLKISQCLHNGMWIDPQLPLYGLFAQHYFKSQNKPIQLQLVNFSKTPEGKSQTAKFDEIDLDSLQALSVFVATSILNAEFLPASNLDTPLIRRLIGDLNNSIGGELGN